MEKGQILARVIIIMEMEFQTLDLVVQEMLVEMLMLKVVVDKVVMEL